MIRHIVAIDQKRGIARDGVQPWKLPTDETYFSDMTKTLGGVILVGRTTFDIIGRPLPGRQNFVASRDNSFSADGVSVVRDLAKFLDSQSDVWVIGGAQIYAATLSYADELYVTEIAADFSCDMFYPVFTKDFHLVEQGNLQHENNLDFRFSRYIRGA